MGEVDFSLSFRGSKVVAALKLTWAESGGEVWISHFYHVSAWNVPPAKAQGIYFGLIADLEADIKREMVKAKGEQGVKRNS